MLENPQRCNANICLCYEWQAESGRPLSMTIHRKVMAVFQRLCLLLRFVHIMNRMLTTWRHVRQIDRQTDRKTNISPKLCAARTLLLDWLTFNSIYTLPAAAKKLRMIHSFGYLLMLQSLRPVLPNLPYHFSTFHPEYPSVLSQFCLFILEDVFHFVFHPLSWDSLLVKSRSRWHM